MRYLFSMALACLLVLTGCGGDPSGPGNNPTPSVLQVELTGKMDYISRDTASPQLARSVRSVPGKACLELQSTCMATANWTICPDTDFFSYVLYRSTSPGISENTGDAEILCLYTDYNQHTFLDDSLSWETHYYYVLRTANGDGNYAWSNEDTLTTPSEPNNPTPSILSLEFSGKEGSTRDESESMMERPAVLHSSRGTCQITATWTQCPDSDFASYTLYKSFNPDISEDTTFAENLGSFTTAAYTLFTDSEVNWETTYYYALVTRNTGNNAAWSNECGLTTPSEGIPVTEPNSSTVWEIGDVNTQVVWFGGGTQVKLEVWYAGVYVADFSGWITNTGNYTRSAPIPTNWGIGLNFRIRVVESGSTPDDGFSEEFQIYDDINVTQPHSETVWAWGQDSVTVEWNEPYSDSVYIGIYKDGSYIGSFSDWVPNTGSYTRDTPIPSAWGTGEDYTIRIDGSLGSAGYSDMFTIWAMDITEPDSMTVWTHYQTNTQILWVPGPGSNVQMEVWQGSTKLDDYCSWTPDDGEYTRTEAIPDAWGTGTDFQIKMIDDLDNVGWSSEFSILSPWPDSVVATVLVGSGPYGICSLPSGEYVYVINTNSNTVSVIRTSDNTVVETVGVTAMPHDICSLPSGDYVYITNYVDNSVSVIRTSDNTVVATVEVGSEPGRICSLPSGEYVYVTQFFADIVSVIRTSDNMVVETVSVGNGPNDVCSLPSGEYVYVTNFYNSSVSVVRTSDNTVVATVGIGVYPYGICSLPSGEYVYVTNYGADNVSVIRTSDNTVVATVGVEVDPMDICSLPSGDYVYVTNRGSNSVSVIRTLDNTVVATVEVGTEPNGICSLPSGGYLYVTNSGDNTVSVIQ